MSSDLRERLHALSTELPVRDAGGRGEELASETIGDMFVKLGLQTDIDGFNFPGTLHITRSVYMLLLTLASWLCFAVPEMRGLGLSLSIVGLVLLALSFYKTDPIAPILSKVESQNVIGKYVPPGLSHSARRSKIVITAYYDVQRSSILLMPPLRGFYPIARKIFTVSAPAIVLCCLITLLPLPDVGIMVASVIGLIGGVVMVIGIVDQLAGSFLKLSKGANCNGSGLAVLMALAEKIMTTEAVPSNLMESESEEPEDGRISENVEYGGEDSDIRSVPGGGFDDEHVAASERYFDVEAQDAFGQEGSEFAKVAQLALKKQEQREEEMAREDFASQGVWPDDGEQIDASRPLELISAQEGADHPEEGRASTIIFVDTPETIAKKLSQGRSEEAAHEGASAGQPAQRPSSEGQPALQVAATAAASLQPNVAMSSRRQAPSSSATAPAARAASDVSQRQQRRRKVPSWWQDVAEEKKRGEIGRDSAEENAIRSRFADAPAYVEPEEEAAEQPAASISGQPEAAAPERVAAVAQDASAGQVGATVQVATQAAAPVQAAVAEQAAAPERAAVQAETAAQAGVESAGNAESEVASGASEAGQTVFESDSEPADSAVSTTAADSSEHAEEPVAAPDTVESPAIGDGQAQDAGADTANRPESIDSDIVQADSDGMVAAPTESSSDDPSSTIAHTPSPISDLDRANAHAARVRKKRVEEPVPPIPEAVEVPLMEPSSDPDWPSGSYRFARDRYTSEESGEAQPAFHDEVSGYSRDKYMHDDSRIRNRGLDSSGGQEQGDVGTASASDAPERDMTVIAADLRSMLSSDDASHDGRRSAGIAASIARIIPNVSGGSGRKSAFGEDTVRGSLLDLPVVGSKDTEITLGGEFSQTGLDLGSPTDRDSRISAEGSGTNLTGAFAPLDTTGAIPPVTTELLDQYNESGGSLYIEDADDSTFDAQYNDEGSFVGTVPMKELQKKRRFSLFGRRKSKRKSKDEGYDESASQWLGVSSDYDARSEGAEIGSWDNFGNEDRVDSWGEYDDESDSRFGGVETSDVSGTYGADETSKADEASDTKSWFSFDGGARSDSRDEYGDDTGSWDVFDDDADWRGGAYGASTEAANRAAIDVLSDELLNKEIWFVALGASGASGAGMRNLLRSRSAELRHSRIVNIESIGVGDLRFTAAEPHMFATRKVDLRMQRLVGKSARAARVEIEPVDLGWRTTQATSAIEAGARAITLMAIEDGTVPGWRWTDDVENAVSEYNLEDVYKLLIELIKNC